MQVLRPSSVKQLSTVTNRDIARDRVQLNPTSEILAETRIGCLSQIAQSHEPARVEQRWMEVGSQESKKGVQAAAYDAILLATQRKGDIPCSLLTCIALELV